MIVKLTQHRKVIPPIFVAIIIIIGSGTGYELGGRYLIHSETVNITQMSDDLQFMQVDTYPDL
jgi:hypothetical protein